MRRLPLLLVAAITLAGCPEDDKVGPVSDADITVDGLDGGDADVTPPDAEDADGDAEVGPETEDTETEVVDPCDGVAPTIDFSIQGAQLIDAQTLRLTLPSGEPAVDAVLEGTTTCIEEGRTVTLTVDGAASPPTATVATDGSFTFTRSLNGPADYTLRVEASDLDGQVASATKSVQVRDAGACAVVLEPDPTVQTCPADSDPGQDGVQLELVVRDVSGLEACSQATLTVDAGDGPTTLGPEALVDSEFTFVVDVPGTDTTTYELDLAVEATVIHETEPANNDSLSASYAVDSVPPTPVIVDPDPITNIDIEVTDDTDLVAPGIQIPVGVTVTGTNGTCEAFVGGATEPAGSAEVDAGTSTATIPNVSFLQSGTTELKVVCTDGCDTAEVINTFEVFLEDTEVTILGPAEGVLLAADDGDPSTTDVYEVGVEVQVTNAVDGEAISVWCAPAGDGQTFFKVAEGVVDLTDPGNSWTIDAAIDTAVFGNEVQCLARYQGPNGGDSPTVAWTLAIPGPAVTIAVPDDGALLSDKAAVDVSGTAAGLDGVMLDVALRNNSGTAVVTTTVGPVSGGLYSATLDLTALGTVPDGSYTLEVAGIDGFGNQALDSVAVVFDTLAPGIAQVQPSGTLVPGDADGDPATPGYQTTLVYEVINDAEATCCLSLNGVDKGCEDTDANAQVAWNVTLQPGPNNDVEVTCEDAAGNQATPFSVTLNLQIDAPVVAITAPAGDVVVTTDTLEVTVEVTDPDSGDPVSGLGTVTLWNNGADTGVTPTDNGDGTYTFAGVSLTAGDNALQATADNGTEGASDIIVVTYKTTQPTIGITAPSDGALFNLASPECAGTGADCLTTVTATTTNTEAGSAAVLSVDCEGTTADYTADSSGGTVSWANVVLFHGGDCALSAVVTDAAGQQATSGDVTVTVDRVAPVLSFKEPAKTLLTKYDDKNTATPEVDYFLQVDVSGVESGQTLTVVGDEGGVSTPIDTSMTVTGGGTVDFGTVPFDVIDTSGVIQLTASVTDAAGNPASVTKLVQVVEEATTVRIVSPGFANAACPCTSSAVCDSGTCWRKWNKAYEDNGGQVGVTATGFVEGIPNVRICSNHPSFQGSGATACTAQGTVDAGLGTFYEVKRFQTATEIQLTNLQGLLPAGFQRLVAEVRADVGGQWFSSITTGTDGTRQRRVLVDVTPPAAPTFTFPDDADPTGVLNIAESTGTPGDYTMDITSDADAVSASLVVNAGVPTALPISGGAGSAVVTLPEGPSNALELRARDRVDNVGPAATATVAVDLTAPNPVFENPASGKAWIGPADDTDVLLSVADGVQVALEDGGTPIGTATGGGGQVAFPGVFAAEGTYELVAVATDPAGNSVSKATTPATVTADFTAPSASITSPDGASPITTDADPGNGGFQVAVDFDTGDALGSTTWTLAVANCPDDTFTGCSAPVQAAMGTVPATSTDSVSEVIDTTLASTDNYVQIVLTATDQAGNVATDTVNVQITLTDCTVSFSGLGDWFNASDCAPSTDCDVTVTVVAAGGCGSSNTIVLYDSSSGSDVALGAQTALTGTEVDFVVDVSDGQTLELRADAQLGVDVVGSTSTRTVNVDLVAPVATLEVTDVAGFTTPGEPADASDIELYNLSHDQVLLTASLLDVNALVRMTDANATGGGMVSVELGVKDGGSVAPISPSVNPVPAGADLTFEVEDIALPNQQVSVVVFTVQDEAGNIATTEFYADADMDPPGPLGVSLTEVDHRLPKVTLGWNAVGDDGTAGGPADSYQVRYSRSAITEDNWNSACPRADLEHTGAMPAPAAIGTPEVVDVAGPDPRDPANPCAFVPNETAGTWHFAARALDSNGNLSPLSGSTVDTSAPADQIVFRKTRVVNALTGLPDPFGVGADALTNTGTVVGDVDGDGFEDFVFGSATLDTVCLLYGAADLPDTWTVDSLCDDGNTATGDWCDVPTAGTGLRHQCATSVAGAGRLFGTDMRPLGDINGDGFADFGVGSTVMAGSTAELIVFLGSDIGPDMESPELKFVDMARSSFKFFYDNFCGAGDFFGMTTGDPAMPVHALAVGAPGSSQMHVVAGDASWVPGQPTLSISVSSFAADLPVVTFSSVETGKDFGFRCSSAGDVRGDAKGDIAIGHWQGLTSGGGSVWRVAVIPGRAAPSGPVSAVVSLLTPTDPAVTESDYVLIQDPPGGDDSNHFGTEFIGGVDVTGDTLNDLVVAHFCRSTDIDSVDCPAGDGRTIEVISGTVLENAAFGAVIPAVIPGSTIGSSMTAPYGSVLLQDLTPQHPQSLALMTDWDGWSAPGGMATPDLIAVDIDGTASLRVNHDSTGPIYLGLFPRRLIVEDAELMANGGWWVGAGDLDGDGRDEFVLGTLSGEVVIVR